MKNKIESINQIKRKDNTRIRKIDATYYLIVGAECYEVNEIGAMVVNAIGKELTIDDVCSKLSDIYSYSDIEQIKQDVEAFIDFLFENNIIEYA